MKTSVWDYLQFTACPKVSFWDWQSFRHINGVFRQASCSDIDTLISHNITKHWDEMKLMASVISHKKDEVYVLESVKCICLGCIAANSCPLPKQLQTIMNWLPEKVVYSFQFTLKFHFGCFILMYANEQFQHKHLIHNSKPLVVSCV